MDFTWKAIYNDNSFLTQYKEDGTKNGYENIDRTRLVGFEILDEDNKPILTLFLEPGQRLIYRRVTGQVMNDATKKYPVILVGWQQTISGKNIQSISTILPDKRVIQSGKWLNPKFNNDYTISIVEGISPILKEYEK